VRSARIIVGLGEILWDIYADDKYLGGAPANVAVHSQRLGAHGVVASAVGLDDLGDEIIETLEEQGLDASTIHRCSDRSTGTVGVKLNEAGVPDFVCSEDTAFDYLRWNEGLERLAGEADAVIVGTLAQRNRISRQTIQKFLEKAAGTVVFDVNFRGWNEATSRVIRETLVHTDILKLNENELYPLRESFQHEKKGMIPFLDWLVREHRLKIVALSLGAKGCFLTDGKVRVLSPGVRVDAVDTTGCGDGFVAGLIVEYLKNASLEETAEFANYLGAFLATMKGAVPRYTLQDLDEFRAGHRDRVDVCF
jgi:fructokinase